MRRDHTLAVQHQPRADAVTTSVVRSRLNLLCFALLIITLPFAGHVVLMTRSRPRVHYEFTSFVLYLTDIVLIGALAVWWLCLRQRRNGVRWGPPSIIIPLALLPALGLLSALWAPDPALAVYTALRLTLLFLLFLWIVDACPGSRWIDLSILGSLLLESLIALGQFGLQHDLGLQWLGEIRLNPRAYGVSVIAVGERAWLRGYGLTPHPNILGGVLAVFGLMLLVPYLRAPARSRPGWLAALAIAGAGLIVSFSRSAWLGAAIGGTLMMLAVLGRVDWRRRYRWPLLVPTLVGLLMLAGVGLLRFDLFAARLSPFGSATEARSVDERVVLTQIALEILRRRPLVGVGAGNFSTVSANFIGDQPEFLPQPVHNVPLLVAAELGPVGGALWVWLTWVPFALTWQRYRAGRMSLRLLALTASLAALAIASLFDFYTWGWPQGRLLQWTFLGLWGTAFDVPPP